MLRRVRNCRGIIIIIIIIIILDLGTSFPGCETLNKVCGVWNGYNGDSEIVKVLDRQTALKCWIAAEIRWYGMSFHEGRQCSEMLSCRSRR